VNDGRWRPRKMHDNPMLPFRIFYPLMMEKITCDTRVRLSRRGRLVMSACGALETKYDLLTNRMGIDWLAEMNMGNYYVKRRMNLRKKKLKITVNASECVNYPQMPSVCFVSVDRHRRKVVPYIHRRKSERRNVVNPIHSMNFMETRPQGRARMERAEETRKSKSFTVMVRTGLAGMERKNNLHRKMADFWQVYYGYEPMTKNNYLLRVNLR
jgi:hypothetical protein